MAETKVTIEGMSCQHCVMAVKKALGGVPAVSEIDRPGPGASSAPGWGTGLTSSGPVNG